MKNDLVRRTSINIDATIIIPLHLLLNIIFFFLLQQSASDRQQLHGGETHIQRHRLHQG